MLFWFYRGWNIKTEGAVPVPPARGGRIMWRRVLFALVGASSMACAAAGSSTRPVLSAGRDVITAAEIVGSRVTDVYQAVSYLRPEFLRRRGSTAIPSFTAPPVRIYLDNLEFGSDESLRSIPLQRVRLIRYLGPNEAQLRWGRAHPSGAILVTTMR